jgi:hypothetical protein
MGGLNVETGDTLNDGGGKSAFRFSHEYLIHLPSLRLSVAATRSARVCVCMAHDSTLNTHANTNCNRMTKAASSITH